MTPDKLHDAITQLPEELLATVDVLRQKKRFHLQPLAALAACLCLAVGLWMLPISAANDKSNGSIGEPEGGRGDGFSGLTTDQIIEESTSTCFVTATVTEITEQYFIVQPENAEPLTVWLNTLEEYPAVSPGETIRIYYHNQSDSANAPIPYRIERVTE